MELVTSILAALNALSPLGVIALLVMAIITMIWKSPFKPIEKSLNEVKENHLHELPTIAKNIETMVEVLQRIEVKQGEEFAYIKARLNGNR